MIRYAHRRRRSNSGRRADRGGRGGACGARLGGGHGDPYRRRADCLALAVAVWGFASGRFFEPLPLLASVCALLFVVRPLQLFSGWRDLYSAFSPSDPIDRMVLLDGQEMARGNVAVS